MNFLFITVPIALFIGFLGLLTLLWALKSGQYEDVEGPKYRILFDDENEKK